uniref:Uncharacterized protein n=1 Tax=Lactuca sativa TaxID=4236 RepID=A0A9R1X1H9_LACSA|nr:hypothetical protein LSAT_V11C800418290 [Lactuca sativa]
MSSFQCFNHSERLKSSRRMSNTRSCSSLDDLPIEILSRIILMLGSKKMYAVRGDPQVFRTASLHMIKGIVHNNIDAMFLDKEREAAYEDHFEAICLLAMIYIPRGSPQCDQGLQLLDAYFGWAVPGHGEYIGVIDSARDLLNTFDVVHILKTNKITFQCEEARHSDMKRMRIHKGIAWFAVGMWSTVGFVVFLIIYMVDI